MRPHPALLALLLACAPSLHVPGSTRTLGSAVAPATHAELVDVASPAPRAEPPPPVATPKPPDDARQRIAAAARALLGKAPSGFRDDCSGFVCAVYARAGLALSGDTGSLWEDAVADGRVHKRRRPGVGDLAFFDDTWDRNGNGRVDDPLTHVAVVIEVAADGTVVMAHRGTREGRSTLRMNLEHPHEAADEIGRVLNDYLRAQTRRDRPGTHYLASELWRGFARPPAQNTR